MGIFKKQPTGLTTADQQLLERLLAFNRAGLGAAPEPSVSEINALIATGWPKWHRLARALKEFGAPEQKLEFIQALFNFQGWCAGYAAARNGLSLALASAAGRHWSETRRLPFFQKMREGMAEGTDKDFDKAALDPGGSIWTLAWFSALGGPHLRDIDDIRSATDIVEATAWLEGAEHRFEDAMNMERYS